MTNHVAPAAARPHRRAGFTLVELLVVIGIIALLISMLLPALNRARQAANAIDCQARLRQMGQAMFIYTTTNKGMLPWGGINYAAANPSAKIPFWWWTYTLSEVSGKKIVAADGTVTQVSPIFRDRDTIDAPDSPTLVSHYAANPRVLYRADNPDPAMNAFGNAFPQRRISGIKHSDSVFVIWDAPQVLDSTWSGSSGNTYPIAEAIDYWAWYTTGLLDDAANIRLNVAILPGQVPGSPGFSDGSAVQKKFNVDSLVAFGSTPAAWEHLRFRHMNNSTLCALVLDGHVATRRVGTVLRQDIYTNR